MGEETDNGKQKDMKLFIVLCKLDSSAPCVFDRAPGHRE